MSNQNKIKESYTRTSITVYNQNYFPRFFPTTEYIFFQTFGIYFEIFRLSALVCNSTYALLQNMNTKIGKILMDVHIYKKQ